MSLARHKRDWEELAAEDPLWAVLTDPARRGRGWTVEEFLATGEREVESVLARARELGVPASFGRALDFGCGAGRITRGLAGAFTEAVGVDISAGMVEEARRINADCSGCAFVVNDSGDLRRFADGSFDFVYSALVLQHLPGRSVVASYVREFVRLLAPGGAAAFQLPVSLGVLHRLQTSRRAYRLLRALRVPERSLLRRTPFTPMRMLAAPEHWVRSVVEGAGGRVVAADPFEQTSRRYWVVSSSR
ncbi:MAG: class I SAM-dependent methyltransferase [Gaiellaceae bacterium]